MCGGVNLAICTFLQMNNFVKPCILQVRMCAKNTPYETILALPISRSCTVQMHPITQHLLVLGILPCSMVKWSKSITISLARIQLVDPGLPI